MDFRPIQSSDLPELFKQCQIAFPNRGSEPQDELAAAVAGSETIQYYTLIIDNQVAGCIGICLVTEFCQFFPIPAGTYCLGWFQLAGQYRGEGYGYWMLKEIEKILVQKGVNELYIDTSNHERHSKALKLYKSMGYEVTETVYNEEYKCLVIILRKEFFSLPICN